MKKRKIQVEVVEATELSLYQSVRKCIAEARAKIYAVANYALVEAYWNVGREIVEAQGGANKAKYGDGLINAIAGKLSTEFGTGFSKINLTLMRRFYLMFPKVYTLSKQLSWSHYRLLITVENNDARQYYQEECEKGGWSVRILKRQIETDVYERQLKHHLDNRSLKALVKREPAPVADIVRSPAILEFAGITQEHYLERDLQQALVKNMGKFLLELGRGFCFVGEQNPIKIADETYHCDLVFYNYLAKCFFLIDLKVGKVKPQDIGQMQLYKHYYERNYMNPGDNPPVGIVLGSSVDSAMVDYTLNEAERNLFAVKYHLELPTPEELQRELLRERAAIEEALLLKDPKK